MADCWDDYLVLKPRDGGLRDLFQLLFSSNISKNDYIESPEGATLEGAKRRMLLFISIVLQRTILFTKKPMFWVGYCIEFLLNLVSENKNLLTLVLNMIRGKLKLPDKKSPTFRSLIGHVDHRLQLDKTIKSGDARYLAALSVMAAKLAYENEAFTKQTVNEHWKMEFIEFYDCWDDYQEALSTQAFMFCDKLVEPGLIVVAFRGTEPFDANAWCTDIDFSWYELPGIGKVHGGFMKALGLQKQVGWPKEIQQRSPPRTFAYYAIKEKLKEILGRHKQAQFVLTGHSLGGALAILFPTILAIHGDEWMLRRMAGVYTFGQPRVGDEKFGEFVMQHCFNRNQAYYRFVYCNDIVPRLPYDDKALLFKHFGTCLYYNSHYDGQIVIEEPNKNYFAPWSMLPRHINAVWELIRSFIIRYRWGSDYREGWFLRFLRVLGLIFPGLLDHNPQDYVNLTRQGTTLITSTGVETFKID
ncbi:triacylglycerol lipase OBL1-like [Aristolochia californica]|uniref:triacylglycerol lipase OBL1-like n=1 Tax=Aristolochia californica TaxID=171875 RepID=UPI0035DDE1AD